MWAGVWKSASVLDVDDEVVIEAFNPSWSNPTPTGGTARRGFYSGGRGVADDDNVYVLGGIGSTVCEVYDGTMDAYSTLTNTGFSTTGRAQRTIATNGGNDYVYVFGGDNGSNVSQDDIYRYDIAGDSWTGYTAALPSNMAAQALAMDTVRNEIYLLGGSVNVGP